MDLEHLQQQAARIATVLTRHGLTLAVAESVTGGAFCALMTRIPGVSTAFIGGAVVYSAQAKIELADVDAGLLAQYSTVAPETSLALAHGIRQRLHTDIGMGVTGNAGPTAEGDAPVGVVYWAITGPIGEQSRHQQFDGDRIAIQQLAVVDGLTLLEHYLETLNETAP